MEIAKRAKIEILIQLICYFAISYSLYLVFLGVPNERFMGPVQRIFYFHVGSAIACYCAVASIFFSSIFYLATREPKYDCYIEASGEVAIVFCSITLFTGMIWGKSAWNTWFRWEPRLVSFLILWLILLGVNMLRMFGDKSKIAQHSAVFGIIAAITVPLVIFSIKLLPQMAQLHPQVIENRGLRHPMFRYTWGVTTLSVVFFQGYLIWLRARLALVRSKLDRTITT